MSGTAPEFLAEDGFLKFSPTRTRTPCDDPFALTRLTLFSSTLPLDLANNNTDPVKFEFHTSKRYIFSMSTAIFGTYTKK